MLNGVPVHAVGIPWHLGGRHLGGHRKESTTHESDHTRLPDVGLRGGLARIMSAVPWRREQQARLVGALVPQEDPDDVVGEVVHPLTVRKPCDGMTSYPPPIESKEPLAVSKGDKLCNRPLYGDNTPALTIAARRNSEEGLRVMSATPRVSIQLQSGTLQELVIDATDVCTMADLQALVSDACEATLPARDAQRLGHLVMLAIEVGDGGSLSIRTVTESMQLPMLLRATELRLLEKRAAEMALADPKDFARLTDVPSAALGGTSTDGSCLSRERCQQQPVSQSTAADITHAVATPSAGRAADALHVQLSNTQLPGAADAFSDDDEDVLSSHLSASSKPFHRAVQYGTRGAPSGMDSMTSVVALGKSDQDMVRAMHDRITGKAEPLLALSID